MKYHRITVTFAAPPLSFTNRVLVENATQRDSVIAWAREQGHEVHWDTVEQDTVLNAEEAIRALSDEIRATKDAVGG